MRGTEESHAQELLAIRQNRKDAMVNARTSLRGQMSVRRSYERLLSVCPVDSQQQLQFEAVCWVCLLFCLPCAFDCRRRSMLDLPTRLPYTGRVLVCTLYNVHVLTSV